MVFCDDMDLLHWEPNIFRDAAAAAAQTLLSGTGDLAGTTFTLDNGSLYESHIQPNQVIVLSGSIAGSYLIVSVDADGQLTLSVLHDKLFPRRWPTERKRRRSGLRWTWPSPSAASGRSVAW